MSGFLITVRSEPADERHCEGSIHRCPLLDIEACPGPKCRARPKERLDCDWRGEHYARTLRSAECLAAEREARDEPFTADEVKALGKAICTP